MDDILDDIADLLEAGEKVYFHKGTNEILSHPDPRRWNDAETEYLMNQVLDKLALDPHPYIHIDPPEAHETYRFMEEFAFTLEDPQLIKRLNDALQGKKPFRLFRSAIEEAGLEDDWYDFQFDRLKEYAKNELARQWDD